MTTAVSLFDLTNISIGCPEPGLVNFVALHTLLHSIIKHLHIEDLQAIVAEVPPTLHSQSERPADLGIDRDRSTIYHRLELKVLDVERQLRDLSKLPSGLELLERSGEHDTPVSDMWHLLQLQKKTEANKDGVDKAISLLEELLGEIGDLKKFKVSFEDRMNALNGTFRNITQQMAIVDQMLHATPGLEQYVRWEALHETLVEAQHNVAGILSDTNGVQPSPYSLKIPAFTGPIPGGTGPIPGGTGPIPGGTGPIPGGTGPIPGGTGPIPGGTGLTPGQKATASGRKVTSPLDGAPSLSETLPPASPSKSPSQVPSALESSLKKNFTSPEMASTKNLVSFSEQAAERFPQAVTALRRIGFTADEHHILAQRVSDIEKNLGNVDVMDMKAMLNEYRQRKEREHKEKHQKKQERETARDHERGRERAGGQERGKATGQEGGEEGESEDEERDGDKTMDDFLDGKSTADVKKQIAHLRVTVKHIADELNGLRKIQEQETATGAVLQQQMDKLGPVLEKIMGSSCALLGMSLGFETDGTCPVCSLDVSKDASNLCQRFQALQETVNSIMDNQGDGVQDLGLRSRVQNSILELYGECEKLNQMAGQLLEDDQQQQKKIEHLFETVGRLEERKVDRDEGTTETRVSRAQFDAVTDQMNRMIQGLLHKICAQEKDWGKILEKLSSEVESKLDRIELDPLKKQLENRWKSIHRQLQRRGAGSESAAGLRRQLINHFHCLSCDRPLDLKSQCAISPVSMPISTTPVQCYRSQKLTGPFEMQYGRHRYRSERIADLMENFPPSARSCGGSHTLTFAHGRRCTRQHQHQINNSQEEEYDETGSETSGPRNRQNCKLPSIGGKDVNKGRGYRSQKCHQSPRSSQSGRIPSIPQQDVMSNEHCSPSQEQMGHCVGSQSTLLLACPPDTPLPAAKETLEIHMDVAVPLPPPEEPVNT